MAPDLRIRAVQGPSWVIGPPGAGSSWGREETYPWVPAADADKTVAVSHVEGETRMKNGVPPWVLIAVAGITALATLLAALISGLIAYRTSRRSVEHAAEMARLDREAAATAQHRSARRAAYASYVTAGITALRDITAVRDAQSSSSRLPELKAQAVASSHATIIAYGVVEIEGPTPVASSAKRLNSAIADYRRRAAKRHNSETSEDGTEEVVTVSEPGKEVETSSRAATKALYDFVAAARESLSD
jgi:hypothetical protein